MNWLARLLNFGRSSLSAKVTDTGRPDGHVISIHSTFDDILPDLPDHIVRLHAFLIESGFSIANVLRYKWFIFEDGTDDTSISYERDIFEIVIYRDRLVWNINIRTDSHQDRTGLFTIKEYISGEVDDVGDIEKDVEYLERHLSEILAALGADRVKKTREALERIARASVERRFGPMPGSKPTRPNGMVGV
jgi:hypothetical protein